MKPSALPIRTLLIVDDEPDVRMVVREMVEELGYACAEASSGEEGLQCLREGTFHAVLSDIMMPDRDGIAFLQAVRAQGLSTPFIFLTGHESTLHLKQAIQLGVVDFLDKPVDKRRLADVVNRALDIGARHHRIAHQMSEIKRLAPELGPQLDHIEKQRSFIEKLAAAGSKGEG